VGGLKQNFISKDEYLELMREIFTNVQTELANRLDQYEVETIRYQTEIAKEKNEELSEKKVEQLKAYIEKLKSEKVQQQNLEKEMDLIINYPNTLEPPTQDQNEFLKFKKFDKIFTLFKFNKKVINPGTQLKLHRHSRPLIQADGFKIIQTPLTNRVFLVGGDANPWGTFEFDLETKRFLPEGKLKGGRDLINPLAFGRSHHSLAATSGLIFCTGGKPEFLRRKEEEEYENNDSNGRVIEVFKLKDGLWIEYSDRLMNPRC